MRRSRPRRSRSCARDSPVSSPAAPALTATVGSSHDAEEFGIYLNYVRKLGFEETPDYDFLRELFAKVLKNINEPEDGVYDWNLLNGEPLAYPRRHDIRIYGALN